MKTRLITIVATLFFGVTTGLAKSSYNSATKTITVSGTDNTLASLAADIADPNVFSWNAGQQTAILTANLVITNDAQLAIAGTPDQPVKLKINCAGAHEFKIVNYGTVVIADTHISAGRGFSYQIILNGKTRLTRVKLEGLFSNTNSWADGLRLNHDDIVIDHCEINNFIGDGYFSFGNYPKKSPSIIATRVAGIPHSYINYASGNPEIRDCEFLGKFYTSGANSVLVNTKAAGLVVEGSNRTVTIKYYLDVLVVDASNKPVVGAKVTVVPENGGTVELGVPMAAYRAQLTELDGHTPLPDTGKSLVVTESCVRSIDAQGKERSVINYTYTIRAEKDGKFIGEIKGVDPDNTWYRPEPSKYVQPITIYPGNWSQGSAVAVVAGTTISNVKVDLPNGRFPVSLLIDDPAPGVNPLYYFRRDVDKLAAGQFKSWEASPDVVMVKDIPVSFLKEFADWVCRSSVRGKFSVVPYPMGLGSIAEGLDGYDRKEVAEWIKVVREQIVPSFDITPEILTHTLGLDLKTKKLLPIAEHKLTSSQNLEQLTKYMTTAMEILKKTGLTAVGVTQPCEFKGDQANVYAPAVLAALKKVNGIKLGYYFLDVDEKSAKVLPKIMYLDQANGEVVVSIPAATVEPMWEAVSGKGEVNLMADYFVTADGQKGRFLDLMKTGSYLTFYTHWQSLYGNGTRKGLLAVQEIERRVNQHLGDRVKWMKVSEIARYFTAGQTCKITTSQEKEKVTLILNAPFTCPDFTLSFDLIIDTDIAITIDGQPVTKVAARRELKENGWVRDGSKVYLSFPLKALTKIEISAIGKRKR